MEEFDIIVSEKAEMKIDFKGQPDSIITEVRINQVQPASAGKKIRLFCTYDIVYFNTEDSENSGDELISTREKLEIVDFIIGSSSHNYKTEFFMCEKMNPVFSVVGPGSLHVLGKIGRFITENDETNAKEESVEKNVKKNEETNDSDTKKSNSVL